MATEVSFESTGGTLNQIVRCLCEHCEVDMLLLVSLSVVSSRYYSHM